MGAELLPMVFTSGWASGINAYAVVVLLGVLGRFAGVDDVPATLQRTDVLVVAAALLLVEMVADKVPFVDSAWDAVHTVVRPAIGAAVAALLAGDTAAAEQALMATTGGVTALASHAVKAGLRLAVNSSPEPASNIAVSAGEDLTVAGVVALLVVQPWVAAGIAGTLLLVGAVFVVLLLGRIRRARRRWRSRRLRRSGRH
jgi:Domain of unknown function (DUF4126)